MSTFQFSFRTFIRKNNFTTFLCYAKNDVQSVKFSQHQKSFHVIAYQKNKDILVKFDENLLFFTNLMRFRFINAHESFSSSLMSRSRQI